MSHHSPFALSILGQYSTDLPRERSVHVLLFYCGPMTYHSHSQPRGSYGKFIFTKALDPLPGPRRVCAPARQLKPERSTRESHRCHRPPPHACQHVIYRELLHLTEACQSFNCRASSRRLPSDPHTREFALSESTRLGTAIHTAPPLASHQARHRVYH